MLTLEPFSEDQGRSAVHPARGIPPISFLAPCGFTHPLTRTHVRLLGPCFKTGRMGCPQAGAGSTQTAPRGATGSGHDGALTLSGAPFQGTWARSAAEDASPDYNSDSQAARFSSWADPGSLAVTKGILVHVHGSFCFAGFDNDPSAGSPTETLLRLLLPLNDKACFEHSNFFKVTAPEARPGQLRPGAHRRQKGRDQPGSIPLRRSPPCTNMPMHDRRSFRKARTLNEGKNRIDKDPTAHIAFRIQETKRCSKGHAIVA
ncbi:hypothetical protein L2E82_53374 [Cichorium intybus]|nr:hypothetical protein L2E82_53374 [Cichorium intybus]